MSFQDPFSPRSSIASSAESTASSCLPKSRIRCSSQQIVVGGQKYNSASDALIAYLQQFESTPPTLSPSDSLKNSQNNVGGFSTESPSKLFISSTTYATKFGSNGTRLPVTTSSDTSDSAGQSNGHTVSRTISGTSLVVQNNGIKLAGEKADVEELLTSKVSPSLQAEVTDTLREVKLRRLLKQAAMKSQNQTKTGLQQEVEAALTRSAQLLERVTQEETTHRPHSDNNSLATEALLSDSSVSLDTTLDGDITPTSSIIYPHRRRPRRSPNSLSTSLSQSLCAPVSYRPPRQSRERVRHSSMENLAPLSQSFSPGLKRSSSSSSASLSNQSDPTDILRRIRSRSVSPGQRRTGTQYSAPEWVEQLDRSVQKSVPSWVGELATSEISESVWAPYKDVLKEAGNKRPNGTKVPSWVGEVEGTSSVTDHLLSPDLDFRSYRTSPIYKSKDAITQQQNGESSSDVTSESRPGLNYSDLATNLAHTPSKQVTFNDSVEQRDNKLRQPKHSTPLHNGPVSITQDLLLPKASRMLDSEYNGEAFLRNNILPQTARLKKSIDNFVTSAENLGRKSVSSNSSDAGSSDNKCSSLDTQALLMGKPLHRIDITGASTIPKDSQMASKSFSMSPTLSGIVSPGEVVSPTSNGVDHESSDGLEGDRSWERLTNTFKAPVPVDGPGGQQVNGNASGKGSNNTLSGGKQPGSMEALKNMLFKLQAEENSTQEQVNNASNGPENTSDTPAMLPALEGYDFSGEPGGHSLEKALVHLNRLKKLVKSTAVNNEDNSSSIKTPDLSPPNISEISPIS